MSNRFTPREHLRRPADFRRVYDTRCSSSVGALLIFVAANGLGFNRVGFSVSRKLIGNAVKRNRSKRVLREAYRLSRMKLPTGYDIVLVPRSKDLPTLDMLITALPRVISDAIGRAKPMQTTTNEVV